MVLADLYHRGQSGVYANGLIRTRGYLKEKMTETIVVDQNGRVYLPKLIRKLLRLEPNSIMEVAVLDDQVILRRVDSVAQKGRGMFARRDLSVQKALNVARRSYAVE